MVRSRGLSRATVVVSMVLVMLVVTCQGQTAEVTIPMENTTVLLREEGKFFCQVMGNDAKLRINGQDRAPPYNAPGDLIITVDEATSVNSLINVSNITITITATKKRNNTLLECYDQTMSRADASKATLIVRGGPAQPEVSYEILISQKVIVLLWRHPFTWNEYPITGYHIMCTDTDVISINNTDNKAVIQHTVELDQDTTDCHTLQCNVTASNALDDSVPSVTDISIPLIRPVLDVGNLESCGDSLSVTVMVIPLCVETEYPVLVTFGARVIGSDMCEGRENATLMLISSGESATFSVGKDTATDTATLRDNEEYCYIVSINGKAVNTGGVMKMKDDEESESAGLSTGAAVGITLAISLLVVLPVGVALGCCGMWYMMRRGATSGKKVTQLQAALYEEPAAVSTAASIHLTDNQAYGRVNTH